MKDTAYIPEGKKRVQITLTTSVYLELKAIAKRAGMPTGWLSQEIDNFLPGLLAVAKQAEKDAMERKGMSEGEATACYLELMKKAMKPEDLAAFEVMISKLKE